MNNVICYACRGQGMPNGCPQCGRKPSLGKKGAVTVTAELLEKHVIPEEYIDIRWDINELKATHPSIVNDSQFNIYCEQLTKIFNIFDNGSIPNQSVIVIAGRGMGKMTFAYTCMRQALEHGYSVCQVLDNTQLKRINILSADRPKNNYTYRLPSIDDVENSDVLFITVDIDNYSTALRTIESVMRKRMMIGKSTFVLSRFGLDAMSQFEKKDSYLTLMESRRKYNNRKYPVILKCL